MPIGKYDRFVNKNWEWQTSIPVLPQLDVKAFEEVLGQQQAQVDQVGLLSTKMPNVMNNEPDLQIYQAYKKDVDSALEKITQEYGKGATAGQMAYKNYLNQFRKDWSPGGRADLLNKRSEQYQAGLKAIDDFYKDDSSPVNKTLAKQELASQLKNPIISDPSTGKYTSISTPELYKNPKINEGIDQMLKEIKENGTTSLLGDLNRDWYVQKIKTETREPERIKLAYQALSQQPEYASQIDRDTKYRSLTTDGKKYQDQFTNRQNQAFDSLSKINEEAKTDSNKAKQLQSLLRQEGYNLDVDGQYGPQTQKAADEYLKQKKEDVQSNINGFDLNSQLRNDVSQSYLGYALRGAYEKRDMDPVFNQAKKAMMEDARKRDENSINRDRLNFEYGAKDQSQILAVDGIAQQLPEIQKYAQDSKINRDELKGKLDKAISGSETFRGWKLEDIGQAYTKWLNVTGNTEEEKKQNYKNMLNQGSEFQFSDKQVQALYEQMMAPDSDTSFKTMLKGYSDADNEVQRLEDGQSQIASQYVHTPEGKKAVANLRKEAPENLRNLSDQELIDESISNPDKFEVYSYNPLGASIKNARNPAKDFQSKMGSDVKAQAKNGINYDWGSLGTTEIYAGTKDETLRPAFNMLSQAVETGDGMNFETFGNMGLTIKDNSGKVVDNAEAKKVGAMSLAITRKGVPIVKTGITMTLPDGKTKDGYTEIKVVPGSAIEAELTKGATEAYIKKYQAGEKKQAAGILDFLDAVQGEDRRLRNAAMDLQIAKLNLKNTGDDSLLVFDPKQQKLIPISNMGWQSKDLMNDENIAGMSYKTYGLNTPTGNFAANVIVDESGNKIIVPSETGYTYKSTSGVSKDRKGKLILSNADVIVNKTKQ